MGQQCVGLRGCSGTQVPWVLLGVGEAEVGEQAGLCVVKPKACKSEGRGSLRMEGGEAGGQGCGSQTWAGEAAEEKSCTSLVQAVLFPSQRVPLLCEPLSSPQGSAEEKTPNEP